MRCGSWGVDSTGPFKDPQIVQDFFRSSDKPGITIFVRGSAHKYSFNVILTPYLNLSKVAFPGFFSIISAPTHLHEQVRKCGLKAKIVSRGYGEKQTF